MRIKIINGFTWEKGFWGKALGVKTSRKNVSSGMYDQLNTMVYESKDLWVELGVIWNARRPLLGEALKSKCVILLGKSRIYI